MEVEPRTPASQASMLNIIPARLVRVKGVKVFAKLSIPIISQLAVCMEFCQFRKEKHNRIYIITELYKTLLSDKI